MVADVAGVAAPADSRTRPRRPARRTRSHLTTSYGDFPNRNPVGRGPIELSVTYSPLAQVDRRRSASVTNQTRWGLGNLATFIGCRPHAILGDGAVGSMMASSTNRFRNAVTNRTHWGSGGSGGFRQMWAPRDFGRQVCRLMVLSSPIRRRRSVTNGTHWEFGGFEAFRSLIRRRCPVTNRTHWWSGKNGGFQWRPTTQELGGTGLWADGGVVDNSTPERRDQSNPLVVWRICEDPRGNPFGAICPQSRRLVRRGSDRAVPNSGSDGGSRTTVRSARPCFGPGSGTGLGTIGRRNRTSEWPWGRWAAGRGNALYKRPAAD